MGESGDNILDRAIRELPVYQAPDRLWSQVERKLDQDGQNTAYDRALEEYRQPRSAPDVWDTIISELDQDQSEHILRRAISKLPVHKPKEDRFGEIIHAVHRRRKSQAAFYWISGVAASVSLIMAVYFGYAPGSPEYQITHTEELQTSLEDVQHLQADLSDDDEVLAFIRLHCDLLILACEEPLFKGLLDQYLELNEAQGELISQIEQNQSQVQLMEYLVRVEKEKTDVGNQLIQYIVNS